MRTSTRMIVFSLAAGSLLSACGSGSHRVANSATTTSTSATSATSGAQLLTVTPSAGLNSPATVRVVATGFSPGEALVVTECANKGSATGPGDCNLAGIKNVTADTAGRITTSFTVIKGPFGSGHIVCGSAPGCLVSVSQASLSATQEADAPIGFA